MRILEWLSSRGSAWRTHPQGPDIVSYHSEERESVGGIGERRAKVVVAVVIVAALGGLATVSTQWQKGRPPPRMSKPS